MISPGTTGNRGTTGNDGFELAPVAHTTSQLEQLREGSAHGHLEVAGTIDVSGDGETLTATVVRRPQPRKPIAAVTHDGGRGGEGLGVIDRGGCAVEAEIGRERRLEARQAFLPFQGFQ